MAVLSAPAEYKPELRPSTYAPSKARDPFGWSGVVQTTSTTSTAVAVSTVAFPFRLEGIMYDARQPSAIINNQLVVLKKPVTLRSGGAAIEVRATEITADRVVLEAGGRSVELKLAKPPPAP
jgi:hypothetical protein